MFKRYKRVLILAIIVYVLVLISMLNLGSDGKTVTKRTKTGLTWRPDLNVVSSECGGNINRTGVNLPKGKVLQSGGFLDNLLKRPSMDFEVNVSMAVISSYLEKYEKVFDSRLAEFPDNRKINTSEIYSTPRDIMCRMYKKAYMCTIDNNTSPFREMGLGKYFKSPPLMKKKYRSCAVVGSSVSMKGLNLGAEIDAHEAVFRLNLAPVMGFEKDVGMKTTLRVINNQFIENTTVTRLWEQSDDFIRNDIPFFLWKGASSIYNGNLYKFYKVSNKFVHDYLKWTVHHPTTRLYLINPIALYRGWDVLQEFSNKPITRQIPSSGFVGVQLALTKCKIIHVYGLVPPINVEEDTICHYYDEHCVKQYQYHPIDGERNILKLMNTGSKYSLKRKGRLTFKGFSSKTCTSLKHSN